MVDEPRSKLSHLKYTFFGSSQQPRKIAYEPTKRIGYSRFDVSNIPSPKAYLQHTNGVVPGLYSYQRWLTQPVDTRNYLRPAPQDLPALFDAELNSLESSPEYYTGEGRRSFHFKNGQYLLTQNGQQALIGQTQFAPDERSEIRLIQSAAPLSAFGKTFRTWQLEGNRLIFRVPGDFRLSPSRQLVITANSDDIKRWVTKFQHLI